MFAGPWPMSSTSSVPDTGTSSPLGPSGASCNWMPSVSTSASQFATAASIRSEVTFGGLGISTCSVGVSLGFEPRMALAGLGVASMIDAQFIRTKRTLADLHLLDRVPIDRPASCILPRWARSQSRRSSVSGSS